VELSKLKQLVETLRALGVTKYKHEGTEIELGEPVYVPPPVDLQPCPAGRAGPARCDLQRSGPVRHPGA
jgi:hypothetical protein